MLLDARERFEATYRARARLDEVKSLIMYDGEDWQPEGVRSGHEMSDPTATRAIYAVDELADKLDALKSEERELENLIGESLAIIEGVRVGFGDKYADVLDARYIDRWKWSEVSELYGVTERTVQNWAQVAFEWIDSVGVSRLLRGEVDV